MREFTSRTLAPFNFFGNANTIENSSIPLPTTKGDGEVVTSIIFSGEYGLDLLFFPSAGNSVKEIRKTMVPSKTMTIRLVEDFQFEE